MIYAYVKTYGDARIVNHLTAILRAKCRAEGLEATAVSCRASDDREAWIFDVETRWAVMPQKLDALRAMIAAALEKVKATEVRA